MPLDRIRTVPPPAHGARARRGRAAHSNDERQGADVFWDTTGVLIGLLVGILCGLGGAAVFARVRSQTAQALAEEILANARREAETIRKEADLDAKEEALRRREALDAEVDDARRDLREQEKRLEKRADLLDQKLDLINKKEREFESVQRYLAEQQEDLDRREAEVKQVLADQRETLHRHRAAQPRGGARPAASAASRTSCGTRSAA